MNTQVMESDANGGATIEVAAHRVDKATGKRKLRNSGKSNLAKANKASKKDQLVALLSKPNGARISVIVERLGWQAHTVRAALSGLRKRGVEVNASKSPKTGETVYAIVACPKVEDADADDRAVS